MPRLAIAQIRPAKGEYAANVARIGGVLAQIAGARPQVDLLITPETSTSGYFVEGGVPLAVGHDRRVGWRPADPRTQRLAGARLGHGGRRRAAAGERGALGAGDPRAGRGARRVRRLREPGRVRGRQGVPRRLARREPG